MRLAKSCRECNLKASEEKGGPWSQHMNTCRSGKTVAYLQIHERLLMIIRIIRVINVEKKNQ